MEGEAGAKEKVIEKTILPVQKPSFSPSIVPFVREYLKEAKFIQGLGLALGQGGEDVLFESPVNIDIIRTEVMTLDPLSWNNYDVVCKKIKMVNTGHTLMLSANWPGEEPSITGGPLLGNYTFSQLHFHWGKNNMEGSEHRIDGGQYPLEMHVLHYNNIYFKHEYALSKPDGIVVLAYLFKMQAEENPCIEIMMESIREIQDAGKCARIESFPLHYMVPPFYDDYFVYWGNIVTRAENHMVLWLLTRTPIGVSSSQMDCFRMLFNKYEEPLIRNFREVKPLGDRQIYHANPSGLKNSTMLQICVDMAQYK